MDDSKLVGTFVKERMYKLEETCACNSPSHQRFICCRCLSSFSLLGGPFPGRLVSKAEYQYPHLRLKGFFYFLLITALLIPVFGSLQWKAQPKCSRCFNVLSQLLGIE